MFSFYSIKNQPHQPKNARVLPSISIFNRNLKVGAKEVRGYTHNERQSERPGDESASKESTVGGMSQGRQKGRRGKERSGGLGRAGERTGNEQAIGVSGD